jgi:hypothetical protein
MASIPAVPGHFGRLNPSTCSTGGALPRHGTGRRASHRASIKAQEPAVEQLARAFLAAKYEFLHASLPKPVLFDNFGAPTQRTEYTREYRLLLRGNKSELWVTFKIVPRLPMLEIGLCQRGRKPFPRVSWAIRLKESIRWYPFPLLRETARFRRKQRGIDEFRNDHNEPSRGSESLGLD